MKCLFDTSALLRFVSQNDPLHSTAAEAVVRLGEAGYELVLTPQVVREAWCVLTRPTDRNGYGLTPAQAELPIGVVQNLFPLVDEAAGTHSLWLNLVKAHAVSGVQVHDANHVATMIANGITHVFTLNPRDFARYAITVVTPDTI